MDNQHITSLLSKIEQRLLALERKVDTIGVVISRLPGAKAEEVQVLLQKPQEQQRQQPRQQQQPQPQQAAQPQQPQKRQKPMFKAVCADCHEECELPFEPKKDRPVYCNDCWSLRKAIRPKPGSELPVKVDETPIQVKDVSTPIETVQLDWRKEEVKPVEEKKEPEQKRRPQARNGRPSAQKKPAPARRNNQPRKKPQKK